MAIYALGDVEPKIHETAFVHPQATVIGNVEIGAGSSIWPQAVLRGDGLSYIRVGVESSIQDGSVIHVTDQHPTIVGDRCVIGHLVHLEGCTVEDDVLVGNGAVVLHRVVLHSWSLVGSNAVVTNDTIVPSRAMALGIPAKILPDRVADEAITYGANTYKERAQRYRQELRRLD
ncbi:MAG: carbonic anhydrase/acetyltransferase-like protein (isoleucine patch superfamily) [Acidimicrobiales bacterium]|jgi:carbonic anhydrase/acetyltransferase-like protein (isoleucine patch superfamily)